MLADLHTHTNASDANLSREQLLEIALARGVDTIAITDHDTMRNSYTVPHDPLRVLKACELSTYDTKRDRRVHILCYLPADIAPLEEYFAYMAAERTAAGEEMFRRVQRIYPVVNERNIEPFMALGREIHRQNIMSVLMHFGYTTEMFGPLYHELFDRKTGSCHVGVTYWDYDRVLEIAKASRGVSVLAHPSVFDTMELAAELAEKKAVDGIEINHPRNRLEDRVVLETLCRTYDLLMTGGSDYHGANSARSILPGDGFTTQDQLARLEQLATSK